MEKKNLDGSALSFPQDALISFEESTHTYTVKDIGEMTPVSRIIADFFNPFDAEYWSMKKCGNDVVEAARLREVWESNGRLSSQTGTHLHQQIENYINDHTAPVLKCNISYEGSFIKKSETVDISLEWSFFEAFNNDISYKPFRTEWCVYDDEARMAGTIDLLCSRDDGTYEIYDWKRSNKIDSDDKGKWATGINGLNHLPDTPYNHYCIQQNLYRYMLEKNYGLKISRMNLVVLHPNYNNYKVIPVPIMQREVKVIIDCITPRR